MHRPGRVRLADGSTSRRVIRRVLLLCALVVGAAGAWQAWQTWQVYRDLSVAADQATLVQDAVSRGDVRASKAALDVMQQRLASADERTHRPGWAVVTHLPLVGDDASGVQLVSEVLLDLTRDGVEPVADQADEIAQLVPHDGRIPIASVTALQEPVSRARLAFAVADERLGSADTSGYLGRWRVKYLDLATKVSDARQALDTADTAVQVLPSMLGQDGVRRYLLVFQNNAEVRSTGGLPGSVAVVQANDGRISLKRIVTGASFGEAAAPVLPLSPAEQTIYGDQLGRWFLDANFTPDFPRAADLWRARYEQLNAPVDGVLSVDPVALSYLLQGSAPIQSGAYSITAGNTVATLMNSVYVDIQDPDQQDATFRDIAKQVFDRVTTGSIPSDVLLQGLARSAREHRLYVHSFHPAEQASFHATEVSGELSSGSTTAPQVGVYLNDTTGAKMSYYLRTDVDVHGLKCTSGVQTLTGRALLESLAPEDPAALPASVTGGGLYGIPAGSQLVTVRLYAPAGGTVSDLELDGKPVSDVQVVEHDTRPVATLYVQLAPGQGSELTWRMTTSAGQVGDVQVGVTPGIEPRASSSVAPSVC